MEWVRQVPEGLERLEKKDIAAVLLDLRLPDGHGIETFDKVQAAAPSIPILILADNATEEVARHAVSKGAQDYLPPDHLDSYSLARALRSAIERKAVEDALYTERERAIVTLNSIGDAVLSTDVSGNITYLNAVAEKMTGWLCTEAVGEPLAKVFRIIDGVTRQTSRDPMEMAVEQNRTVGLTVNCILIRRDGAEFPIEAFRRAHTRSGRPDCGGGDCLSRCERRTRAVGSNDVRRAARSSYGFAESHSAERSGFSVDCIGSAAEQNDCLDVSGSG